MKSKKTLYIAIGVVIFLVLGLTFLYLFNGSTKGLTPLEYSDITEKIENKESFVLCVSASDCIHCQNYKPKLASIARRYNINIYYIDVDKLSSEKKEEFKKEFNFDGGTPTTIFFKDGEEKTTATRINGDVTVEKILNKLKNNGFIEE